MNLFDWQVPSALVMAEALSKYRIVADASETGTGKTFKALAVAKQLGMSVFVICPKAVVPEWIKVAGMWGVPITAVNYEKVRTGKTPIGEWAVKGKVFKWKLPADALLVFDEAHNCGGMKTQNSKLLIAAKRQGIRIALLSATLIAHPLKCYAIGYALGLHKLTDFWPWTFEHDVKKGYFGMEWRPQGSTDVEREARAKQIMENIRVSIGAKFTRIRKVDVPDFPQNQIIPQFVDTPEREDLVGDYTVGARQEVELMKVGAMGDMAESLIEEGYSVVLFVNFVATLEALQQRFPNAGVVRGGQSTFERSTVINRFQQNAEHLLFVMSQAGGTGLSLHDLHGRPRAAIISPGWSAVEFLQVLGRIHRAGSLSPAVNYVLFASGVPVERRIRERLEAKLNNLAALNDYDLYAHSAGTAPAHSPAHAASPGQHADEHHQSGSAGGGAEPISYPACGSHSDGPGSGVGGGEHSAPGAVGEGDQSMNSNEVLPEPQQISTVHQKGEHKERKHAASSPSKLKSLEICPSYESDNSTVHPVTLRGTAMHEALETGDDSKLDPVPEDGTERPTTERDLVAMVREYIESEKSVYGVETVEDELHLKTHDPDVQGFVDRVMIGPIKPNGKRTAYIRDYKFGFNLVDSPSINPQAQAYTLGLFMKRADVDEVNFAFMIPRLDAILEHTFTRADIPAMMVRISTIAERRRKLRGKEFNPQNENCLYCANKATCVALHQKALVIANGYNEDEKLALPTEFHSSLIQDPVQMAKALNVAAVMEKWVDSVRAHALALRLEVGVEIPGYQLIERQGKRTVQNTALAWDIAQQFGVTQEEFMAAADVSIPQLEKAVSAKVEKGKAKKVQEFNDALLDANAVTRGNPFHVLQKERKKKADTPATLPEAA